MPELKHYSILIAELIFPIIIFALALKEFERLPEEDRLVSGAPEIFVLCSQGGILILFASSFLTAFVGIY